MRQLIRKALLQFRLDSIRGQILAFAILAALIPSLIISLIAYAQSRRALTEKITQELVTTASTWTRVTVIRSVGGDTCGVGAWVSCPALAMTDARNRRAPKPRMSWSSLDVLMRKK